MNKKLLVITRDQKEFREELGTYDLQNVDIYTPEDEAGILEHISDAEILFGNPILISKYINQAKNLKWMQSSFAGIDAMNKDDLKKDYTLTNMRDTYGEIISEYVLGYMLLLEKDILGHIENQKKKIWGQKSHPSLVGKTMGIMGIGSIGGKLAQYAKTFGMNVLGYASTARKQDYIDQVYTKNEQESFLGNLDYLVNILPSTPETTGIINAEFLNKLSSKTVLINVGRGANIVEQDLISALKNNKIAGAVLDVFCTEPLPEDSELWSLNNVFITPHVSGYVEDNSKIVKIFAENYQRYLQGEELLHKVDFSKGY